MTKKKSQSKKRLWKQVVVGFLSLFVLVPVIMLGILYWDYRGMNLDGDNNLFERIAPSSCLFNKKTEVHSAYITDANYLYPTQVAAYSAIKNKCPNNVYHFHILTDGIPPKKAEAAFKPLAREDVDFEIVPQKKVLDMEFSDFLQHISSAAMLKFTIADTLPNVDRVIFMDSDTIVVKDLAELFNQDLEDNIMAAVADIATMAQPGYLATIGYREKHYYNAGMFLLDLNQMRQKQLGNQLNEYVRRNPNLVFIDQDAYNVVLRKKIKKVPYIYNCMATMHFERYKKVTFWMYLQQRLLGKHTMRSNFIKLYPDELPLLYRNLFKDVVVFHYFGFSKPWRGVVTKPPFRTFYNLWHQYADALETEVGIKPAVVSNIGKKQVGEVPAENTPEQIK